MFSLKNKSTWRLFCVSALLCANGASAHEWKDGLGADPNAIDIYQLNCENGTESLIFDVTAVGKGPAPTFMVYKDGVARASTDNNVRDSEHSPEGENAKGPGNYLLFVHKNGKKGRRRYALDYHCWGGGTHTGTGALTSIQVQ